MSNITLDTRWAVDVLEAAGREACDLNAWLEAVSDSCASLLSAASTSFGFLLEPYEDGAKLAYVTKQAALWEQTVATVSPNFADPAIFVPFFVECRHVALCSEIEAHLDDSVRRRAQAIRDLFGAQDGLGLIARTESRRTATITGLWTRRKSLAMRERMFLSRVVLHIEAGLRLRGDPSSLVAVLRPDGTLVHAEAEAQAEHVRRKLARHAATMERTRLKRNRAKIEAVDAWSALVAGRYGFVEARGAQREYLVFASPSGSVGSRRWSSAEARAVELSAAGMTGKLVGYALGVSSTEVSRLLGQAASKAGFATRTELVRLVALLRGRGAAARDASEALGLTFGERQVLEAVRRGLSNGEIAALRGTSTRTVANQVAALLRKTRLPSRRALATLML